MIANGHDNVEGLKTLAQYGKEEISARGMFRDYPENFYPTHQRSLFISGSGFLWEFRETALTKSEVRWFLRNFGPPVTIRTYNLATNEMINVNAILRLPINFEEEIRTSSYFVNFTLSFLFHSFPKSIKKKAPIAVEGGFDWNNKKDMYNTFTSLFLLNQDNELKEYLRDIPIKKVDELINEYIYRNFLDFDSTVKKGRSWRDAYQFLTWIRNELD